MGIFDGGGGIIPFETSTGSTKKALIDSDGHLQVDVVGVNQKTEIRISGNYTYIGKAVIGSATSSAVWQIKRLDTTLGLEKLWANGNDAYTNIFNNYLTISFS